MQEKNRRRTVVFVAMFVLAGVAHMLDHTPSLLLNTVFFCSGFAIYSGLLLYWTQSLRRRLLPESPRGYMTAAAMFMVMMLVARAVRYRIVEAPKWSRFAWYVYYIPILMMPTLFLLACIRFDTGVRRAQTEVILFTPALTMAAMILTNDAHNWAFRANPDIDPAMYIGETGTYTYGWLFYAAYAWVILTVVAGIIFLVRAASKRNLERQWHAPVLMLVAWIVVICSCGLFARYNIRRPYEMPEINIFGMIGVFEACIRTKLLQVNDDYEGFFACLDIPAVITDGALKAVYRTAEPVKATEEQLREALAGPVYIDEDTRLSGRALRTGYVFWQEDESAIHRLNERLAETGETLGLENDLLRYETEQQEQRAQLTARNAVYARAAGEVYSAQKRLEAMLADAKPGTEEFVPVMAKACVLCAYVKRKSNLVLSYSESGVVSGKELYLALDEMVRYMRYCGIAASAEERGSTEFFYAEAIALYETFALLTESMLPQITRMMVVLREDCVCLITDAVPTEGLPETPLPVASEYSDELWYLTVRPVRGGAV